MWRLHVDAATRLADALLPAMAQAGTRARAVLIGSRVWRGLAGRSQYAATKAALVSLARSWAAEVAERGVTVNVVSPAATDTPMLADPAARRQRTAAAADRPPDPARRSGRAGGLTCCRPKPLPSPGRTSPSAAVHRCRDERLSARPSA